MSETSNRILLVSYVWPEPDSSAAGVRTAAWLELFMAAGWHVSICSPSRENDSFFSLKNKGIAARHIPPNDPQFDSFIQELQPQFVLFDRFITEEQFGWRVDAHAPHAVKVLDTQDLHFVRRSREVALRGGAPLEDITSLNIPLDQTCLLRELSAIFRSDLTLVISSFEMDLLVHRFQIPKDLLHLVRFLYPTPPSNPEFDFRKNFVSIGNFRHPPNLDSAFWLNREIWPLIRRKIPNAELHLYGAYPPKEVVALDHPPSGFRVLGWAADKNKTLSEYRINLAALRFGAGIKGKITDGWWNGTPCVATPIAIEGMLDTPTAAGAVIAGTPLEFANHASTLYFDKPRWDCLHNEGIRLVQTLYSQSMLGHALIERLVALQKSVAQKRDKNLVGKLLKMNQHRATEYFSRWIEAKTSLSQDNAFGYPLSGGKP